MPTDCALAPPFYVHPYKYGLSDKTEFKNTRTFNRIQEYQNIQNTKPDIMETETTYPVKSITWSQYEQQTPILLQEANGPCPLIALVNTLLLQTDIEARTIQLAGQHEGSSAAALTLSEVEKLRSLLNQHAGDRVLLAKVLACLGDMLLELTNVDPGVVDRLLQNLPLLHTGLTVNPNLLTGKFPENDLASEIFGAFGLNFLHGWCWEPEEGPCAPVFEELQTFDAIQDYLLESSGDDITRSEVHTWLLVNGTQLTKNGLQKIDNSMQTDLLAIFFRNNHFCTLYKAEHHDFYLLITDTAFTKTAPAKYVWQSLISVSGSEDLFFTGDFVPIVDGDDYNLDPSSHGDMELVRRLQEEEDAALAQQMQTRFDTRKKPKPKGATVAEKIDKKARKNELDADGNPKKKGTCVIV